MGFEVGIILRTAAAEIRTILEEYLEVYSSILGREFLVLILKNSCKQFLSRECFIDPLLLFIRGIYHVFLKLHLVSDLFQSQQIKGTQCVGNKYCSPF